MKPVEKLKELNGQIFLLKSNLESLEMLDKQEINLIIISCLIDDEKEREK